MGLSTAFVLELVSLHFSSTAAGIPGERDGFLFEGFKKPGFGRRINVHLEHLIMDILISRYSK